MSSLTKSLYFTRASGLLNVETTKDLLGSVIGFVLALDFDAVVINLTAPMPSSQIVLEIEQNPSLKAEPANTWVLKLLRFILKR